MYAGCTHSGARLEKLVVVDRDFGINRGQGQTQKAKTKTKNHNDKLHSNRRCIQIVLSTHNDAVACFQNNQRRKDQRTITVSSHCCASCSCGQYSPSHRSQAALGQQPRFQRFSLSQPYISPSALLSYTATIPSAHAQVIGLGICLVSEPFCI